MLIITNSNRLVSWRTWKGPTLSYTCMALNLIRTSASLVLSTVRGLSLVAHVYLVFLGALPPGKPGLEWLALAWLIY